MNTLITYKVYPASLGRTRTVVVSSDRKLNLPAFTIPLSNSDDGGPVTIADIEKMVRVEASKRYALFFDKIDLLNEDEGLMPMTPEERKRESKLMMDGWFKDAIDYDWNQPGLGAKLLAEEKKAEEKEATMKAYFEASAELGDIGPAKMESAAEKVSDQAPGDTTKSLESLNQEPDKGESTEE